jgi:hypothetical protein
MYAENNLRDAPWLEEAAENVASALLVFCNANPKCPCWANQKSMVVVRATVGVAQALAQAAN